MLYRLNCIYSQGKAVRLHHLWILLGIKVICKENRVRNCYQTVLWRAGVPHKLFPVHKAKENGIKNSWSLSKLLEHLMRVVGKVLAWYWVLLGAEVGCRMGKNVFIFTQRDPCNHTWINWPKRNKARDKGSLKTQNVFLLFKKQLSLLHLS